LVGAGPGEPGLITVRGLEVLSSADVVLYDALAHPALLDACPNAEKHNVGKRFGEDGARQAAINAQMIELARQGKRVVRLKGGDPLMFARGAEEALALAEANVKFEIVPGVSSPVAASAYAGISLTHRELSSSVTFITGSDREGQKWSPASWQKLATATDTICVLMGMWRIDEITGALLAGGRAEDTPAAVIQWGARPAQRVVTAKLATIAAESRARGLKNPAVIIVGEVVRLREKLAWYEARPLFGRRIVVPRPAEQGQASARAIRERGGEAILIPTIRIIDPPDPAALEGALGVLSSYDWILLTSANGVERLFAAIARAGLDARAFGKARVGVIGPKTAEALRAHGLIADLVADEFVGEGLARAVLERGAPERVLIVRALAARDVLVETLRGAGARVDVVPAYQTVAADPESSPLAPLLEGGGADAMLFTSSSTVTSTFELLGNRARELLGKVVVASIGPVTSDTLSSLGVQPDVTAERYTVDGLLDALERHFAPAG